MTRSARFSVTRLRLYALPILAGFLIGTSYIPLPPWAAFFCLVPLWIFWIRNAEDQTKDNSKDASATESPPSEKNRRKRAFWGGWTTQFILNSIGFHWIAYTAVEFGHFPWWAGALTLLLFCAVAHLYYPATGWIFTRLMQTRPLPRAAQPYLIFALFAFLELIFPTIFPWHLGYPWLWVKLPGVQTADLIGFQGLNVATLFFNALLTHAWLVYSEQRRWRKPALLGSAGLALFAFLNVLGLTRKEAWNRTDTELKILIVQGNIGNWEKIYAQLGEGYQDSIVQKFTSLSLEALKLHPETEVVLWPETAFPDYLNAPYLDKKYPQMLRAYILASGRPLLTGAYSINKELKETYNGFFLMAGDGTLPLLPYHKTILLPFGEYFPGARYVPFLLKMFPAVSEFGRGSGPTVMAWNGWKIGPQICYEGLYPGFSASLARQGAELFTNVTNDSWFGTYFEPHQHLYMTLARAIEFRRPLIRSTNTGITTVVLANGDMLEKSPLHSEWSGFYRVPYLKDPPHTLYEKIEPLWGYALALLIILLLIWPRGRSKTAGLA